MINKYFFKTDYMKTKLLILSLGVFLLESNQLIAQPPTVSVYTPKGSSVTAYQTPEVWSYQDKLDWGAYYAAVYPNATEQGTATTTSTYNCHSYAWNMSEGGPTCWIGYYYTSDEDIYWTDYSYIETTEPNASKISYYADDHSARQTSTQGSYISKWGDKVLMLHSRDYGPAAYQMGYRKYYRLYPGINGTETALCQNQERTFTSNTSISGSTYSWTRDNNLLDYVSGSGTTSYRVKAKSGDGNAWLRLQITTPSGEIATTNYKDVWVGKPLLYGVLGPEEGYVYNTYTFYANPRRDINSQAEYEWILNPLLNNDVRPYYDYTDIAFYDAYCCYQVVTRAYNTCGYSDYKFSNIEIFSGEKMFVISPNPASEFVTISLSTSASSDLKAVELRDTNVNYSIQIYDLFGNLHFSGTRSGDSFTIPVGNLKNGNYFVHINDGKEKFNLKLIVKH